MMTGICSMTVYATEDASPPIPAHTATYDVLRKGSKIGEVNVRLERLDNGVWYYRTSTEATSFWARLLNLSAEESAHFVWRNGRIVMLTYHQVRRSPGRTRFLQQRADWEAGITHVSTPDGDREIPLEDNLVDPLSLRLQLAAFLAQPDKRNATHTFRLLDRDGIETKRYTYDRRDTVSVPVGCFNALRVRRIEDPDSIRTNLSWHHPGFAWMPLRILQLRKDKPLYDLQLQASSLPLTPDDC
ncbi:MAG: DUF3108 domain-containing protein [Pseudomonadota bacterium]|nr:MAG: DUF3108 domain-containing protein [Pseudomonadota bacterium]